MSLKILVTGGAGYIGSHTVRQLREAGYDVVVYDNLSTGSASAVIDAQLVVASLENQAVINQVFAQHRFDAVLHFAASLSVPESIAAPLSYYANNTRNTLNLLEACQAFQVKKFIFSSTAAVYGQPEVNPVTELSLTQPINPYGNSKLMSERMLQDFAQASGCRYVILRYFNVAGAEPTGKLGQSAKKAEHLIKVVCDAALGRSPSVKIFGTDFATPDGTGIRDYIHVEDLASAHVEALRYLEAGNESQIFNCGYGQGYSVRQVIETVKNISGVDFPVIEVPRRPGDPACVIAGSEKIRTLLGWQPKYDSLETIVTTSLNWEKKLVELAVLEKNLAQKNFQLGALLTEYKIISETELEQALQEQLLTGQKLGEILVQKAVISAQDIERFLLEQTWRRQGVWLQLPTTN